VKPLSAGVSACRRIAKLDSNCTYLRGTDRCKAEELQLSAKCQAGGVTV